MYKFWTYYFDFPNNIGQDPSLTGKFLTTMCRIIGMFVTSHSVFLVHMLF